MADSTSVILGETRKITISVRSLNKKPFEITNPSFLLKVGSEVEARGDLEVEQSTPYEFLLSALITPMRKRARYRLEYHYDIAPERLIHVVNVAVD